MMQQQQQQQMMQQQQLQMPMQQPQDPQMQMQMQMQQPQDPQQQMLAMQYEQAMAAQAAAQQQQGGAYSPVPASPAMSAVGHEESKAGGPGGGLNEKASPPPSERVLSAESDPNAAPPRMLKDMKKNTGRLRDEMEDGRTSDNSSVGGGSDDDGDGGGYGSESDGGKSGGDNASVGSDASHLTEPPMEGGYVHYGWSYAAYLDRIERIERFPDHVGLCPYVRHSLYFAFPLLFAFVFVSTTRASILIMHEMFQTCTRSPHIIAALVPFCTDMYAYFS